MRRRLLISRHGAPRPQPGPGDTAVTVDELKGWMRSGLFLRRFRAWDEAVILTDRLETMGRPLPAALAARWLARRPCRVVDASDRTRVLGGVQLARWAGAAAVEPITRPRFLAAIAAEIAELERRAAAREGPRLDLRAHPLYLRFDLAFGVKAGGSVGHTAGVANHLAGFAGPPIVLTTERVPTLREDVEHHDIVPDEAYWNHAELPAFVMNGSVRRTAPRAIAGRPVAFVYQRYTQSGYAAVPLAFDLGVPLVTEYNGSEVWIARHWGTALRYEALSLRIEALNFLGSDLIVVVSRALRDELVGRGVPSGKVLVNPNGVEPDRFSPGIDGASVRARLGLEGADVVGFIGTFGPWHGAEVLAEAFVRLLTREPWRRDRVRLLMVGDGARMAQVRDTLARGGVSGLAVLPGTVPQADAPQYLAACDILVSPHVPNADGSPFFGSPTKLFEYMAMGKGIVASDLDQIGEILEHGRAARMVTPGDVDDLAAGLANLLDDPAERTRLGREARRLAVERHTWREHTRRIVEALAARVPPQ